MAAIMTKLARLGARVGERLKAAGQTVAVAESSSGGLIAAALLAVPGASAYFKGGTVIYTRQSRYALLQTSRADLRELPADDTAALAGHFAERARIVLDATWGIAELGIAGPTGSPYGHDPGTSVLAVSGPVSLTRTLATGDAEREPNMWRFAEAALALLEEAVDAAPHSG